MLKLAVQKEKELEISTSEKHPWESYMLRRIWNSKETKIILDRNLLLIQSTIKNEIWSRRIKKKIYKNVTQ
jgi:hypothetical protein